MSSQQSDGGGRQAAWRNVAWRLRGGPKRIWSVYRHDRAVRLSLASAAVSHCGDDWCRMNCEKECKNDRRPVLTTNSPRRAHDERLDAV